MIPIIITIIKIIGIINILLYILLRSLIDYLLVMHDIRNFREQLGLSAKDNELITLKGTYFEIYKDLIKSSVIPVRDSQERYYYKTIKHQLRCIKYEHPTIYITQYLFPYIRLFIPYWQRILSLDTLFVLTFILNGYLKVYIVGFIIYILI